MSADAKQRVEHELFLRAFVDVGASAQVTQQLASHMRDMEFKRGHTVYREGEPSSYVYFVVSGNVELTASDGSRWTFGDESVIGILDGLLERPYTRTAVTTSDCHMIGIRVSDYFEVLEENFEYARAMLVMGAARHDEMAVQYAPDAVFALREANAPESPQLLRGDALNMIERLLALRTTTFVKRASVQALASLAKLAKLCSFSAGERLFEVGRPALDLHILVAGSVRVERLEPTVNVQFLPVRLVAGLAALGYEHHRYQATAEVDCATLAITKEDLFDVAEDHFSLARAIFAYSSLERERIMKLRQERSAVALAAQSA